MNNFLLVLKNKSFFSLWLSEIFSLTGFHMVNFLLILIAFSLTNSNTAVSGVVLAFSIPAILFGVVAGIYVDRWNKRQVLFVTNAVRFFLVILLGLFFKNLPVLYSVTFAVAIVTQFFIPAETPIIPLLVEKKHLIFANALFSLAWFGAALIAYALSGPLLSFFGTTYALFIIAGFFLIAAFCVLGIQYTHHTISQNQGVSEHVFTQIKKTFQIIFETKNIAHAFLLLAFSQVLLLIIAVIGPGYAKNILNIKVTDFPLLFVTPVVLGMGAGAYLVTKYFSGINRHKTATLGLFISAISVVLLPYGSFIAFLIHVNILHIMIILAFFLGVANSFMFVSSNTLIQESTKDELRGKIYGALNTIVSLLSFLPVILIGSLADIFGVGNVIIGIGLSIGIIGFFRLFLSL